MAQTLGLALTDDQRDLRATTRDLLADRLTSGILRAAIESTTGHDEELWKLLSREVGLTALNLPENYGGLGMSLADVAVVHQELGRVLYPGPFMATWLFSTALTASDDTAGKTRWLPRIASGESVGSVAITSGSRALVAAADVMAAGGQGKWRLSGQRWHVMSGELADVLLVLAQTDDGPALFVVETKAPGVKVTGMDGLDRTRRAATVTLSAAPAERLAGRADHVLATIDQAFLIAAAAEAAGGIEWCLATSVEHAKDRHQFGRPIGSYQAVAHTCVDILGHSVTSAAVARYAAVAVTNETTDAAMAVRVAALRSAEAYRWVTEATIHLLGGMGFTWEHDAHLYYRRSWTAHAMAGRTREQREAIAQLAGI